MSNTKQGKTRRRKRVIVVALVLLLGLMGRYFLLGGSDGLKAAQTRVILKEIATATIAYSSMYGSFPSSFSDIDSNYRRVEFISWRGSEPWTDAWGNPITYTVLVATPGSFMVDITSLGSDGAPDGTGAAEDITITYDEAQEALIFK